MVDGDGSSCVDEVMMAHDGSSGFSVSKHTYTYQYPGFIANPSVSEGIISSLSPDPITPSVDNLTCLIVGDTASLLSNIMGWRLSSCRDGVMGDS